MGDGLRDDEGKTWESETLEIFRGAPRRDRPGLLTSASCYVLRYP